MEQHPDLVSLNRRLRAHMEDTLDAELDAAHEATMRRRTFRDLLLDADDGRLPIRVATTARSLFGYISAVGTDHVVLGHPSGTRSIVPFTAIEFVEFPG